MRFLASICAAMMIFANLAVVYADVAPYPRPRPPRPEISQDYNVTASVTADNRLLIRLKFPAACDYKFQLTDNQTGKEIYSDKGTYETKNALEVVNLNNFLADGENFFLLKVQAYNFKEKTRFGTKIRRGENILSKIIAVTRENGKITVDIYDNER